MLTWVAQNTGNIVVTLILAVIVAAAIFKMVKDKKKGISSCSGNCGSCGMCDSCSREDKNV